tara:strand:+ start:557 stop:772 length:216 start_codon:yes stop_codon:yes gene_type:complete
MIKYFIVHTILFYKKNLSCFLPTVCRFHPTCSQYCLDAIYKYGTFKGVFLGLKRILSCHPLSKKHGYDPLA